MTLSASWRARRGGALVLIRDPGRRERGRRRGGLVAVGSLLELLWRFRGPGQIRRHEQLVLLVVVLLEFLLRQLGRYRARLAVRRERGYAVQQSESVTEGRTNVNEAMRQ